MRCSLAPWLATLEATPRKKFDSGCPAGPDGVVPCDPEALRKIASAQLGRQIPWDVYDVARNIASEAGSGSIAEKVGIAEAAVNRSLRDGVPLRKILLRNSTHYSRQLGMNPAVSTRQDPTLQDLVIAELVLSGKTRNFARGATHYFSPAGLSGDAPFLYDRWFGNWKHPSVGLMWVGPLPGVDPQKQFFMRPVSKQDPAWRRSYDAGQRALERDEPIPPCGTSGALVAILGTAALGGALWYYRKHRR